jgi:hypothetical protein
MQVCRMLLPDCPKPNPVDCQHKTRYRTEQTLSGWSIIKTRGNDARIIATVADGKIACETVDHLRKTFCPEFSMESLALCFEIEPSFEPSVLIPKQFAERAAKSARS